MNGSSEKPKKVRFELSAPEAQAVQLAGDFTRWEGEPLAMKKSKAGVWSVSVSLVPGIYEYRFVVDGQWVDDPACATRALNPFGSENSVRVIE